MKCLSCGKTDVFHRAVVNTVDDEVLGVYCEDCELEQYGAGIVTLAPELHDEICVCCENEGTFVLARLDCLVEEHESATPFEYTITDRCPRICSDHISRALSDDHEFQSDLQTGWATEAAD